MRARAGTHFVAVFGAQQSALEALLLKRRVMGPSWLTLAQPVRVDAGVQARPVLRRHAAPVMSRPVTPASRAAPASRGGLVSSRRRSCNHSCAQAASQSLQVHGLRNPTMPLLIHTLSLRLTRR